MKCCRCVNPTCSVVSIVSSIIVCVMGTIFQIFMPDVMEGVIVRSFVLSKDAFLFDLWANPPVEVYANFYVFNYTNYMEFSTGWKTNGTKPKVEQLGPYVFRLSMLRSNIEFFGKDEVQYNMDHDMKFIPEMSNGSADDVLVYPNYILRSAVQRYLAHATMPTQIRALNYSYFPFAKRTIREFLIDGFNDPLLDRIQSSRNNKFRGSKVKVKNYFFESNLIRVKTGASDYRDIGKMVAFNNETVVKHWPKNSTCSEIKGAESLVFPPHLSPDEKAFLFTGEMCRSIFFQFEKEVNHHGLTANRFLLDHDVMSNTNPNYECFCQAFGNKCWGVGVFNVGPCKLDAPMLLSMPHLINTEYHIQNAIDGLNPDREKHLFFMDLEKTSSTPLNFSIGMQLNVAFEPTPMFREADNVPEIIMPIVFLHNALDLNKTTTDMLKLLVEDLPMVISQIIPMIIWCFGAFIGFLGIFCSVYLTYKHNKISAQPAPEQILIKISNSKAEKSTSKTDKNLVKASAIHGIKEKPLQKIWR